MLTYQELLSEVKRRSPEEQLALLEDLVHLLRQELAVSNKALQETAPVKDLGWPPGYFEQTFGSLKNDPIEHGPQGEY